MIRKSAKNSSTCNRQQYSGKKRAAKHPARVNVVNNMIGKADKKDARMSDSPVGKPKPMVLSAFSDRLSTNLSAGYI